MTAVTAVTDHTEHERDEPPKEPKPTNPDGAAGEARGDSEVVWDDGLIARRGGATRSGSAQVTSRSSSTATSTG